MKRLLLVLGLSCSGLLAAAEPTPSADGRSKVSESENRWVALSGGSEGASTFGYIYVDPQAGFTFNLEGTFKEGPGGHLISQPNEFKGKATLKSRIGGDFPVVQLSETQCADLALPGTPDWMSFYADPAAPAQHAVNWGRAYNHIGACTKALDFLEPAYKEIPGDEGLLFELSYAYNAIGRFADAERVLLKGLSSAAKNFYLNREYAYVLLRQKRWDEAIARYRVCIQLFPEGRQDEKAEIAFNLAQALHFKGEKEEAREWFEKAETWAPEGSKIAEFFKRQGP